MWYILTDKTHRNKNSLGSSIIFKRKEVGNQKVLRATVLEVVTKLIQACRWKSSSFSVKNYRGGTAITVQ